MAEERRGSAVKVRVDEEESVLHITDQSVMFEKGGKVSGFKRSAIRMVKSDSDAMIRAYSVCSEVKSVRGRTDYGCSFSAHARRTLQFSKSCINCLA